DVTDLKLDTLLARDRILIIDDISKKELFDKMINLLSATPYVKNVSDLRTAVYEREDLMSTGIGLNLGIPHVRIKSVKDMAVAFALVKNGVAEYESLDSEPVKLVFMIIAREDQHTQHLKFLSQLSTVLKNDDFRNALIECDNADDLYTLLCGGVDEK
ncbi:MAG: PTS sugar transporter subunit IIA, partial [Lentisphaeria bacterium]|nr:PTS sugar transporter subunit IIA [Lentisphaeria bacterium]